MKRQTIPSNLICGEITIKHSKAKIYFSHYVQMTDASFQREKAAEFHYLCTDNAGKCDMRVYMQNERIITGGDMSFEFITTRMRSDLLEHSFKEVTFKDLPKDIQTEFNLFQWRGMQDAFNIDTVNFHTKILKF